MKNKLGNTIFSYSVKTTDGLLIPINYIQKFLDEVAIQESIKIFKRNNKLVEKILSKIDEEVGLVERNPISEQGDRTQIISLKRIRGLVKSMVVTDKQLDKLKVNSPNK